jgi:hypothetical protein
MAFEPGVQIPGVTDIIGAICYAFQNIDEVGHAYRYEKSRGASSLIGPSAVVIGGSDET